MAAEAITFRTLLSGAIATTADELPYLAQCQFYAGEESALLDGRAIVSPAVLFSLGSVQMAERLNSTVKYIACDAVITARVVTKSLGDPLKLFEQDEYSAYRVIEDLLAALLGSDLGLTNFKALRFVGIAEPIVASFGAIHAVQFLASFNLSRG